MRTERQRRAQQMRDIVRANEVRTGDVVRARKLAEVTARLRGESYPPKRPSNLDFIRFEYEMAMKQLEAQVKMYGARRHDDQPDALKYAWP